MDYRKKETGIRKIILPLALLVTVCLAISLLLGYGKGWDRSVLNQIAVATADAATVIRSGPERIRKPRAAGSFYPAEPGKLHDAVETLMGAVTPLKIDNVRAVLVPHAGYMFSGEVAATSFSEVNPDFNRVFLLTANHNGEADFKGVSLPDFTHYEIPGGKVAVSSLVDELLKDPLFVNVPAAHEKYTIEVELPFLHYMKGKASFPDYTIVPMVLGQMGGDDMSRLATLLSRYVDDKTLFVFSVDLSHFYNDQQAVKLDTYTIKSILSRDVGALSKATTDGNHVLITMVELADKMGWDSTFLKYGNSGHVTGDKNRVVGYGSIVFHQPFRLTREEQKELLKLARQTIEEYLEEGKLSGPDSETIEKNPIWRLPRGVFVTLKKEGHLRGCIGEMMSQKPIYQGIMSCAIKSATKDIRFKPVTRQELDSLAVSISVLEFPRQVKVKDPMDFSKVLRPGKDGVIMAYKGRQSTYLPQVWEELPDPVQFLSNLCLKQGSPANCWQSKETVLYRYGAYEFGEADQ
jgi:AmmeMemoRadiSam system protein B/AmmeMemoRadiSam system protein A